MVENVEVGSNGNNNDKTVKKLLLYKKSIIKATSYLNFDAKAVFT